MSGRRAGAPSSTRYSSTRASKVFSSRGGDGHRSTPTTHKVPILEPAALRSLPFGTAILLLRSAPPIHLNLRRWTSRPDANSLAADRAAVEEDREGRRAWSATRRVCRPRRSPTGVQLCARRCEDGRRDECSSTR